MLSLLGTWPAAQACALTGNQPGDPLVRRLALNPLSRTSHGPDIFFMHVYILLKPFHQYTKGVGSIPCQGTYKEQQMNA